MKYQYCMSPRLQEEELQKENQIVREQLMRKETELVETQQQLRQKVNSDNCTVCCVLEV